jgi:methylated-DNA-protein-cysteine methyltransferase-like protein
MSGFRSRVYAVVRAIPAGRVASYGDVATAMGSPRAARQVGWSLAALGEGGMDRQGNPIPWQRVILTSGHLAFRGDPIRGSLQRQLLVSEGISFVGERVPMDRFRWQPDPDLLAVLLDRA